MGIIEFVQGLTSAPVILPLWWLPLLGLQYLVPLAVGWLGYQGQREAAQSSQSAAQAGAEASAAERARTEYILKKRREVYDPIMERTVLPKLQSRATSQAPWTPQASFWSKQLASKMAFPRTDPPRTESGG